MIFPTSEDSQFHWHVMETLKAGVRQYDRPVGSYASDRMELVRHLEHMCWELRTYILADQLGEERVTRTHRETAEFVGFATWWDHFKATYRGRWWMSWRRWQINYKVSEKHVDGRVDVDMTKYWAFPQANVPVPELGEPVRWLINNRTTAQWSGSETKRFTREETE